MLHEIDATSNGGALDLRVGDEVRILLGENPTTGHRWQIEHAGDELTFSGASYTVDGSGVGAGGKRAFGFVAARPGTTTVRLKRTRGADAAPAGPEDQFEVTLRIAGSP